MEQRFSISGHIRVCELPLPFEDEAVFQQWWKRLSHKEQEHSVVAESDNLITASGQTQLLNYLGLFVGTAPLFSQYFSVGTGAIATVATSDTVVASELARVQPSSPTIAGTTQTLTCFFGTGAAVGTWTNCGMYGNGATSTLGTGTLLTHSLLSYVKANGVAATCQYIYTLTFL